ncbi:hypothetical protein LTR37_014584 [Vermiconidia calcicola]|uniref:Uncharacterized protein n=1 Tax=Vermiconidia calcicola TaxID=1690605 RepID=A0ACC3MUQ1_9PEZI|nr:hypothetical protein LTR37_014584 [Vermiconidia calcicola]
MAPANMQAVLAPNLQCRGECRTQGISKATGVEMYLLVCFNVLLDLFMGCSSGGAAVRAGMDMDSGSKMVHFRTLDWGMPALRRVVVQLDYVLEKDGPVIANSITYAGFVGVLTGVRKNLSMSLNFRANRIDSGRFWSDAKYVWHLLMVLLGQRPSISSVLRHFLLPQQKKRWFSWLPFTKPGEAVTLGYFDVIHRIGGHSEKDRISAVVRSNDEFIVVTNADSTPPALAKPDEKGFIAYGSCSSGAYRGSKESRAMCCRQLDQHARCQSEPTRPAYPLGTGHQDII